MSGIYVFQKVIIYRVRKMTVSVYSRLTIEPLIEDMDLDYISVISFYTSFQVFKK